MGEDEIEQWSFITTTIIVVENNLEVVEQMRSRGPHHQSRWCRRMCPTVPPPLWVGLERNDLVRLRRLPSQDKRIKCISMTDMGSGISGGTPRRKRLNVFSRVTR